MSHESDTAGPTRGFDESQSREEHNAPTSAAGLALAASATTTPAGPPAPITPPVPLTPQTAPSAERASFRTRRTPLFEAVHAARYGRQELIRQIETVTNTHLLCMVSTAGFITRTHTTAVVDLLHNVPDGAPIDLMLNSIGGDIDTAEKLITLIRKRAGSSTVRVIVPDFAKSAATLIALGSDAIVMSDTSELGPIDPQITLEDGNGVVTPHSALNYIDAYEKLENALRSSPGDPVAELMLAKLDPVVLEKLRRIIKRSTAIATDLLRGAMVKDESEATRVAEALSDTKQWHSHGQMIGHERCLGVGLNITYLEPESDLWQQLWRLYCLQQFSLRDNLTLFESRIASLHL